MVDLEQVDRFDGRWSVGELKGRVLLYLGHVFENSFGRAVCVRRQVVVFMMLDEEIINKVYPSEDLYFLKQLP